MSGSRGCNFINAPPWQPGRLWPERGCRAPGPWAWGHHFSLPQALSSSLLFVPQCKDFSDDNKMSVLRLAFLPGSTPCSSPPCQLCQRPIFEHPFLQKCPQAHIFLCPPSLSRPSGAGAGFCFLSNFAQTWVQIQIFKLHRRLCYRPIWRN